MGTSPSGGLRLVQAVLADILGPIGSGAAYLLVAVDVLISHFPATRSALVPFLASPELIAVERHRGGYDQMDRGGFAIGDEPSGRVTLADLRAKSSRRVTLENALPAYISDDLEFKGRCGTACSLRSISSSHTRITPDSATPRSWADTR